MEGERDRELEKRKGTEEEEEEKEDQGRLLQSVSFLVLFVSIQ